MSRLGIFALWSTLAMAQAPAGPAAGQGAATIVDSGSTNRAGFRIVVRRSGSAELTLTPRRTAAADEPGKDPNKEPAKPPQPIVRTVPRNEVNRLFADLDAARPFASLPEARCIKSVSFGSTRTIEYGGEPSPDLSCGPEGSDALRDLIRDVDAIIDRFQPIERLKSRP
jgi:hypothetical protein